MAVMASLVGGVNRLMVASYRTRVLDPTCWQRRRAGEDVRAIYAAWHDALWHGMVALRGEGACAMVSAHRDGELVARCLAGQGFTLVRGSSTRGGARALRDFVRAARDTDHDLCITIDGPRGPAREVKEGVLLAASLTGLPIVPLGCAVRTHWTLDSWDRFVIGKPFTPVVIAFGEPLVVPREASREELRSLYKPRLTRAMEATEARARAALSAG